MSINKDQPKKSRMGLGRGLGSLLGENNSNANLEVEVSAAPIAVEKPAIERNSSLEEKKFYESKIWKIDIEKLNANQLQPRNHFEKAKLKELSDSIKVHGVMNPIVARKRKEGGFEIIAGERRWRASQMAGLKQVPVILKTVDDKVSLELALIENIQRHDLNSIEEAKAYKQLMEEHGLTQVEVAQRLGKERSTIANTVRLLLLPVEITNLISQNKISSGHAKVLLSTADPRKQLSLAKKIIEEKLSVRATEKALKEVLSDKEAISPAKKQKEDISNKLVAKLSEELQKVLGSKVEIDYKNAKGKISLHFYSDEQLNQISENLKEAWNKA